MKSTNGKKFENFISLGFNCGVALALEKYGLRAKRMPFDWCISDWHGVEQCLYTEFADFLLMKNCRMIKRGQFKDISLNFLFPHELYAGENIENKYDEIKTKYSKDIRNFYCAISKPTCFIRAVQNIEEYRYIANMQTEIENVLKQYNEHNHVIFLIQERDAKKEKYALCRNFFVVEDYSNVQCERDNLFDGNTELLNYFLSCSDELIRLRNIQFSVGKVWNKFEKYYLRYNIICSIYECCSDNLRNYLNKNQYQEVAIWGCGNIGISMKHLMDQAEVSVLFFIDLYNTEEKCEGLPVYGKEKLPYVDLIIVSPVWDAAEIQELLDDMNVYGSRVIYLNELLERCKGE